MSKPISFYLLRLRLLFLLIVLIALPIAGNAQALLKFHFDDMKSWDPTGPWGFDADNIGFPTHDNNCFTFAPALGYLYHNYAYKYFGPDVTTVSSCTFENLVFVVNNINVSMTWQQYTLSGYDKYNTESAVNPWNTPGEAGDRRTYSYGTCIIYNMGVPKLYVNNLTFDVTTPYPDQAQMRATSPAFINWTGDVGSGDPITAEGWGDIDMAQSDAQWIAAFAQANNQIKFVMSTMSYVLQGAVGWYDFNLDVMPAPNQQNNAAVNVPLGQPLIQVVSLPAQNINLDFAPNVVGGGAAGNMNVLSVKKIMAPPLAKAFPSGITQTIAQYWDISSTLGTFSCDITFDLTGLSFSNTADWRVLRRDHAGWEIYTPSVIVDANHIKAVGVTDLSEWTIGTVEVTLPVELSSFTATENDENLATINWETQSESELAGYRIYRNDTDNQSQSVCITPQAIPAVNSSVGSSYSFVDDEVESSSTYYYWLEILNTYGSSLFFGPAMIIMGEPEGGDSPQIITTTELLDAYPNPFKQSSVIHYLVKEPSNVKIEVFNAKGQQIEMKSFKHSKAGHYQMTWNASKLPEGVYLYRMTIGEFSSTKKIVLIK